MPKTIPQKELNAILDVVVSHASSGASVDEIGSQLTQDLPRRTLQRRLSSLVETGQLVSVGAGRGSRYYLPAHAPAAQSTPQTLKRKQALAVLARLKPVLQQQYGVKRLALFGSTVRNEAGPESDVDVMVEFDGPATSSRYFGVQFLLEDELGHAIDLVTDKAMRPELRPYIEHEAVDV